MTLSQFDRDLRLPLVDLPPGNGASIYREISTVVPADLGTEVAHVPDGTALLFDVTLTAISGGVLARLGGHVSATAQCVRCLDEIDISFVLNADQLFYYQDKRDELVAEGDEEAQYVPIIAGTELDLSDMVRDGIVTALPYAPLCDPDCLGLCSECGLSLNENPEHSHQVIDPRWAVLAKLKESDNG
ncbi:MAG: YceD family protein [Actinomycetaceae bacterium]|nr:YceD family protein [Actinomycetaceae bacterium]